jgi:hypothetical protein
MTHPRVSRRFSADVVDDLVRSHDSGIRRLMIEMSVIHVKRLPSISLSKQSPSADARVIISVASTAGLTRVVAKPESG